MRGVGFWKIEHHGKTRCKRRNCPGRNDRVSSIQNSKHPNRILAEPVQQILRGRLELRFSQEKLCKDRCTSAARVSKCLCPPAPAPCSSGLVSICMLPILGVGVFHSVSSHFSEQIEMLHEVDAAHGSSWSNPDWTLCMHCWEQQ